MTTKPEASSSETTETEVEVLESTSTPLEELPSAPLLHVASPSASNSTQSQSSVLVSALTPTPTPTGPSVSALVAAASRGDLNLAAESLDTNPGDLLADILKDPYANQALQISTELLRTRLIHELADKVVDSLESMSGEAAGRLLTKLMEIQRASISSPSTNANNPGANAQGLPVQPINILNVNGSADEGIASARARLAERLAASSTP